MQKYKFDKKLLVEAIKTIESDAEVRIGVLSANAPHDPESGATMGTIAAVHEFGSVTKNIPERSFLRSTYHNRMNEFLEFINNNKTKIGKQILKGKEDEVLNKVGAWWVNAVNETFEAQGPGWAPLSPEYAEKKEEQYPGAKILMATGALRRAVTHEVKK